MNVMILAAGEGTRFRPFTNKVPKPALPFLTVPLSCYGLALIEDLKVDKYVVNTYHLPDQIEKLFSKVIKTPNKLSFSHEKDEIKGSGGGLGQARSLFKRGEPILLMNADEIILPHQTRVIENLITYHKSTKALATLLTMDHPEVGTKFGGVWVDSDNGVHGFGKFAPQFRDELKGQHFIGIQILDYRIFNYIDTNKPSNIFYDVITRAIAAQEKVVTLKCQCDWFEMGNYNDYKIASTECLKMLESSNQNNQTLFLKNILNTYNKNWSIEEVKAFKLEQFCQVSP